MRVVRKAAYQGHAIPRRAGYAKGPFNDEILAKPAVVLTEEAPQPFNANAQNDFQGERILQCSACMGLVPESLTDEHVCGAP